MPPRPGETAIVGQENLGCLPDELLTARSREKVAERAVCGVDAFERPDDFGQMLIVRVGDPPIDLPLRLPEDAGERLGRHSLHLGIREQRSERRQAREYRPNVRRRKEDLVLTSPETETRALQRLKAAARGR